MLANAEPAMKLQAMWGVADSSAEYLVVGGWAVGFKGDRERDRRDLRLLEAVRGKSPKSSG